MSFLQRIAASCCYMALLCLMSPLVSGCGSLSSSSLSGVSTEGVVPAGTLTGHVHGGNQPITGATINLYAVGTSGYGSAGTLLATTTSSATDGDAGFSFTQNASGTPGPTSPVTATYTCPTPTTQLYIVSRGGSTQGTGNGTNSAAVFAVAIGSCGSAGSVFVDLNEVTSVGTMAALQQYFNPTTESFGYANTAQSALGFSNNVGLISNLVNIPGGSANNQVIQSATPLGYGTLTGSTVNVTITPEYNKINLIANILAACVNTTSNTSANCATLFSNAVPPTATFTSQPTQTFASITPSNEDTLQALYFMMTNPTSGGALSSNGTSSGANINNLVGLIAATAPFQPAYSTTPTDWTVGVYYKSTNTCVTQSNGTTTTSTATYLDDILALTVDASGNIWSASNTTPGDLYEMSPLGSPLTCGLGTLSAGATAVAIDSAGYVWTNSTTTATNGSTTDYYLYKWNPTGVLDSSWPTLTATSGSTTTDSTTQAIAADGVGNIFYSLNDSGDRGVVKITGAGVAGASPASATSTNLSASINSRPYYMQVDSSGDVWVADKNGYYEEFYPDSSNSTGYSVLKATTDSSDPYGVAIGQVPAGSSVGTEMINLVGTGWQVYQPGSTAGTVSTSDQISTAGTVAGLSGAESLVVDGASNLWAGCTGSEADNWVTGTANSKTTYAFCELSWTGVNISGTGTAGGGFQKDPTLIMPYGMRGVAVDPSGNVWGGQDNGTGIVELVGAAVPVVTPLSTATANGTLGAKP